jgi:AraC family transcriptional activator of tynA and feaB
MHIRADAVDVAIVTFVRRGVVEVSVPGNGAFASRGDVLLTRSAIPFSTESYPEKDGLHEALCLTIPVSLLRQAGWQEVKTVIHLPKGPRHLVTAERIAADLLDGAGQLDDHVSQLLIAAVVEVIERAITNRESRGWSAPSRSDLRFRDVLRYVDTHLSDPSMSLASVAAACRMSERYVSLVLKRNGTSFTSLLNEKRLECARQWLSSAQTSGSLIREVAFRVGFKSHSHFCRLFKREFQISPGDHRAATADSQRRQT